MYLDVTGATAQDLQGFDLVFATKDVEAYSKPSAVLPQLTEFTICFWFLANDNVSELTVLSYVDEQREDSELAIYLSPTGIAMTLGDDKRYKRLNLYFKDQHLLFVFRNC